MIFNLNKSRFGRGKYLWDGASPIEWDDDGADWMMAIPVSGTLTILAGIPLADVCLVAGGQPGEDGVVSRTRKGQGGAGGGIYEPVGAISLPAGEYNVTIGGSGEDTVLTFPDGTALTAVSGQGKAGGKPGVDGDYAWNDPDTLLRTGWRYGAGGGHGATHESNEDYGLSHPGGSVGAASSDPTNGHGGEGEKGGETGIHQTGWPGCASTGQGGGGGRYWYSWYDQDYQGREGGLGGSGCILIRFHKEVSA